MSQGWLTRWRPGPKALRRLLNCWPTYFFAGIRVREINSDFSYARVELRRGLLNRNYFGTLFGGSLYAMTDPFYALMLTSQLGGRFVVWDKSASVRFIKPGTTHVSAEFRLSPEQVQTLRAQAMTEGKIEPEFQIRIIDQHGVIVAEVSKRVYIRYRAT